MLEAPSGDPHAAELGHVHEAVHHCASSGVLAGGSVIKALAM